MLNKWLENLDRAPAIHSCCILFSLIIFGQSILGQVRKQPIARDWFLQDPIADSVAGINLNKAYQLLKGRTSNTVIVAVLDNGVDILHEDLKNIIWTNSNEIPGNGKDDDLNGYIDDVHGWNFRGDKDGTVVENENSGATQLYLSWRSKYDQADTSLLSLQEKHKWFIYTKAKQAYLAKLNSKDSIEVNFSYNILYNAASFIAHDTGDNKFRFYGSPYFKLSKNLSHGTHVAGIIAAQRNNGTGIDGIADNVRIMPVVVSTAVGDERDKDIANGIYYAVENGAAIINMSFSKIFSSGKNLVDEAIRYAEKKNVLIIHCAGNDGVNIDSFTNYHYPIPIYNNGGKASNFITVGWNRPLFDYRLAHPYSNYGKMNVDLFAPGSDIFSTVLDNTYDFKSGSSMSAPVVAGVAALLISYFPSLTASQVKEILISTVFRPNQMVNQPQTKTPVPFNSLSAGGGIVNAYNAVRLAIRLTEKK
jgi:cell wall-associated protease